MIFITGDTHADVERFNTEIFPEQKEMTKDDYVIVLGDFGLVWNKAESKYEKHWLDWLDKKPFTTLFIDGNHENFDRLETYKSETWHGGRIQRIRPSVIHLKRGYVFNLQGLKFFVFGGARSHDIQDGILQPGDPKIKEWGPSGYRKLYRVLGESWWPQEMPTEAEMIRGRKNLAKNNNNVDFVLTHDMPTSMLTLYCSLYANFRAKPDELEDYLEEIRCNNEYKRWFCGHYHDERNVTNKEAVIYYQIVRIK